MPTSLPDFHVNTLSCVVVINKHSCHGLKLFTVYLEPGESVCLMRYLLCLFCNGTVYFSFLYFALLLRVIFPVFCGLRSFMICV